MSVKIDLTQPLSDFEIRYLEDRGRTADIKKNQRRFGTGGGQTVTEPKSESDVNADVKTVEQKDWEEMVDDLTSDELRDELAERELDTKGNKPVLQQRLKAAGPPKTS